MVNHCYMYVRDKNLHKFSIVVGVRFWNDTKSIASRLKPSPIIDRGSSFFYLGHPSSAGSPPETPFGERLRLPALLGPRVGVETDRRLWALRPVPCVVTVFRRPTEAAHLLVVHGCGTGKRRVLSLRFSSDWGNSFLLSKTQFYYQVECLCTKNSFYSRKSL